MEKSLAQGGNELLVVRMLCPVTYALISNSFNRRVSPEALPPLLAFLFLMTLTAATATWCWKRFTLSRVPRHRVHEALALAALATVFLLHFWVFDLVFGSTRAPGALSFGAILFGGAAGAAVAIRSKSM